MADTLTLATPRTHAGHPGTGTAAIFGLGTSLSAYPTGGVTLYHVTVLVLLPALLPMLRGLRAARWLFGLLALWIFAISFTAALVGETPKHIVFETARPVALGLSFIGAVCIFRQGPRVSRVFLASFITGLCIAGLLYHSAAFALDPWKYEFGPVVSLGAVLISAALLSRRTGTNRVVALIPAVAVALVSLLLGFRSEFLVVTVALALTLLCGRGGDARWWRVFFAGACLVIMAMTLYNGYGTLAENGALGRDQQVRWLAQADRKGGVIMGARGEFVGSIGLVAESPLWGRGVSPKVDASTRNAFLKRLQDLGTPVDDAMVQYYFGRGLYLHSVLFQLWVEIGPLAVPGVLLPIVFVMAAGVAAVRRGSAPHVVVFCFLSAQFLWDLLFSPWPRLYGTYLGTAGGAAVLYLMALREDRGNRELAHGHGGADAGPTARSPLRVPGFPCPSGGGPGDRDRHHA
ncbi:hypothetical protein AB0M41_09245 [Streptomyces sp. NPDC051896]|uniref:hypothetical protein n=1 Tax=Streptomyces sp. NPDC051896 TaxID=3155416 RepID=UPI0034494CE5